MSVCVAEKVLKFYLVLIARSGTSALLKEALSRAPRDGKKIAPCWTTRGLHIRPMPRPSSNKRQKRYRISINEHHNIMMILLSKAQNIKDHRRKEQVYGSKHLQDESAPLR